MKILFLTRLFYPHVGGVEKHVLELSKILLKKGHRVTVITTKHDDLLSYRDTVHGINIFRFKQPKIKYFGLLYTWYWLLQNKSLIKESDVIHMHDVFIWYLPFRLLLPNKKVYTTFHGQWGKYPLSFNDILQKKLATKLSTGNICIGDYIQKNYGLKADIISYGATKLAKKFVSKKKNLVVYVGRLDIDISLPLFLKMLKRYHDSNHGNGIKVIFCRGGVLSKECENYGEVLGFTDPTPYYEKAKFCFASGYLTILEALVHKCLVFVVYKNPLQKDYYTLTPFNKFIVIASNPDDLFKKFKYYSKNQKLTEKRIEDGYNWVKTQTWEKMASSYLKLWNLQKI